jgi:ATP-binding cassette subfamily B protein
VYQDRQRGLVVTRYFAGFIWSSLTTLAGSLTYLYLALQAIAGKLTLGSLTLFTQAASSVQGSVQGLLGGAGSMYENNLYLNDLFELLATPVGIEGRNRAHAEHDVRLAAAGQPARADSANVVRRRDLIVAPAWHVAERRRRLGRRPAVAEPVVFRSPVRVR